VHNQALAALSVHESALFRLIGHFCTGYMTITTQSFEAPAKPSDSVAIGPPKLLCKKDIAKQFSVSQRTIQNWTRKKRIPVHRFSARLVRYDPQKVQRALDKYEVREVGRKLDE